MKNKIRKILAVIMTAVIILGVLPIKSLANTNYDSVREAIQSEIDFFDEAFNGKMWDERHDAIAAAVGPILINWFFGFYDEYETEEKTRIEVNRIDAGFMARPEINLISRISALYNLVSDNISNNSINIIVVGYLSELLYVVSLPYTDTRFKDFNAFGDELIRILDLIQDPVEDEPIDEDPTPSYDINAIRHWVALALAEVRSAAAISLHWHYDSDYYYYGPTWHVINTHIQNSRNYINMAVHEFFGFIPTYADSDYLDNLPSHAVASAFWFAASSQTSTYVFERLIFTEIAYFTIGLVIDHGLHMDDAYELTSKWDDFNHGWLTPPNWLEFDIWISYLQPRRELYHQLRASHNIPSEMALWIASESVQGNIPYTETWTFNYFINNN